MSARPDPDLTIIVSLDAAHSMIALPIEASLSHAGGDHGVTGRDDAPGEPLVYEEWGYAERAWYLEKRQGFTGVLRRSCGQPRASSKLGCMNRSGPSGRRSRRLRHSGFRSVKLGI